MLRRPQKKQMNNLHRVQNVTNGFWYRPSALAKAFDTCSVCWVEEGKTVRMLTEAEAAAARIEQAKMAEPLPYYEIPGITFQPPTHAEKAFFERHELVWQAHEFARKAA